MDILKTIVIVIYVINCLAVIILALMQSKDDSGEGKLKRWTIILGITFAILSIVLGILYML